MIKTFGFVNKGSGNCPNTEMCETVPMLLPANSTVLEWASAKGFTLVDINNQWALYLVPSICSHFMNGKCNIHLKRPEMCKGYPVWLERELPRLDLSMKPRNRKSALDNQGDL